MKNAGKLLLSVVIVTFLLAAESVLAQSLSRSLTLNRNSKFGERSLQKGDYTIRFEKGKAGEAVLTRGDQEIVRAPYELDKLDKPAPATVILFATAEDGSYRIKRIEFIGMDFALVLN